jgi:hypothetical protein
VCCVDMGCVAIVVGVPGERRWSLGGVVDTCFRREGGGKEGKHNAMQKQSLKHDGRLKHDGPVVTT